MVESLQKEISQCNQLVAGCKSATASSVPQANRTQHLKRFELEAKTMKQLCVDILDSGKQEAAVAEAQRAMKGFRDETKAWKKARLTYA